MTRPASIRTYKFFYVVFIFFLFINSYTNAVSKSGTPAFPFDNRPWLVNLNKDINLQIDKYAMPGGIVGVAVRDLRTNEYFSINGDMTFNPASVIKVPIMVEAYHQIAQQKLSLDEQLVLRPENKLPGSGSLQFLRNGSVYTVKRLLYLMICDSDNTATNMMICKLGADNINRLMKNIGLKHTDLRDPTMFCKIPGKHNITSPNDMLLLMDKMYRGELISKAASAEMLEIMKGQLHRWGIQRFLPPGAEVANKTGSVDFVRNDIGIIFDKAHPYALSIFSKELPSNRSGTVMVGSISRVIYDKRFEQQSKTTTKRGRRSENTRLGG